MSDIQGPVLVTGATGNTGAPICSALAGRVPVRAMVRSPGADVPVGVEPVVADFDDAAAVASALEGVERAYLVTPSSERAEEQQLRFVAAAREAGVARIVLLSQLGARTDSPVRFLRYHAVVEDAVRAAGLDFTFVRPNLFLQGLLAMAPMVAAQGRFVAPIGGARVSAVDVRDVAAVAVEALADAGHGGATYTVTGGQALTHDEIAAALSRATGSTITFQDVPAEAFAASLEGVLPPWQVDGLLEDYAHYARGEAAEVDGSVEQVTGRRPLSVDDFARDHAAAFRRT